MVAEWKPLIKAIKYNDPVISPIIIMDLKTIWETILKQTSLAKSIRNGPWIADFPRVGNYRHAALQIT